MSWEYTPQTCFKAGYTPQTSKTDSETDFGSAAWFLTSQCDQSVRTGLQSGSADGFSAYISCIGTSETSDRDAYYQRAKTALAVTTS